MWNSIKAETKVIHPKYYKNSYESCTFAVIGRIGPSGQYIKISAIFPIKYPTKFRFHIFMGKANIKLSILYIVASKLFCWSLFLVLGMYNFGWDFTFTNTSTHHSRVIFLLLFCRGIVVSHRTAPFVQHYFVRPHKDSTFGTTWEIANTLYRPVIFACKSTKKNIHKIVQLLS